MDFFVDRVLDTSLENTEGPKACTKDSADFRAKMHELYITFASGIVPILVSFKFCAAIKCHL